MPANKQINKGAAEFFNTLGYTQIAKDCRKIKSREEFHKYMHTARAITAKSPHGPKIADLSRKLESLY